MTAEKKIAAALAEARGYAAGRENERGAILNHLNEKMRAGQAADLKVGTLREAIEEIELGLHCRA